VSRHIHSSELLALGRQAADRIAAEIGMGAGLVHCQLLASQFYDALKLELQDAPGPDEAGGMAAALRRCTRLADAGISPQLLLAELRSAVANLETRDAGAPPPRQVRPVLRVIQGGLAG
jgi:hypothetical protein